MRENWCIENIRCEHDTAGVHRERVEHENFNVGVERPVW